MNDMKLKYFVPAIILFLSACGDQTATDGYVFKGPQTYKERSIKVMLHPNTQSVSRAKPGRAVDGLFGFGLITDKTCEIHVVDPAMSYKPEQLGHELTHCLYGEWH